MTDPRDITIQDFTYVLPDEKIARYPLEVRDASKLLIWEAGKISTDNYRNVAQHIPEGSLVIFNNSKVIAARLLFEKITGGMIEIFCLEPHEQYPDVTTAMGTKGKVLWQCLVGGASKWKRGQVLEKRIGYGEDSIILRAHYVEKRPGQFVIELSWTPESFSFAEILQRAGAIPLPPYIKRKPEASDAERYQTVYAESEGSVAAPTAGLHFTENVLASFRKKNISSSFVTLHVGAGTFKPVQAKTMQDHDMHAEWIDVSRKTIQELYDHPNENILAAGTTSLRTIESLYWLGCKIDPDSEGSEPGEIGQWEAYDHPSAIPVKESLQHLLSWMNKRKMERLITKTKILILPGYTFRIVKGLITNFHQPESTLLLLVAAFAGSSWRRIYDYALANEFRFLSYGDGCLLMGAKR